MNTTLRARLRQGPARLILATTVALAIGLAGCSDDPAPSAGLSLASMSNTNADSTMPMSAAAKTGMGGSAATLATPLPTGPTNGPIYVPTAAVDTAKVTALATALGIPQAPVEQPGGWTAEIPDSDPAKVQRLTVLKDDIGTWFFGTGTQCDLSTPTSGDSTCSSTAVASPDDSLPGSPSIICEWIDSPEAGYAEQARLFFRSIGVTGTPVRTDLRPEGCSGSWALSSTIGGLPVSGLDTVVTLATRSGQAATNNEPSITDASGSFATWTPEGDYPLVDAQQGWDRVAMRPMPAMAELCQVPPDGTGCLATKETMTGGEIGLMRDRDLTSDRVVLVPAWLFTVTSTPYDPDGGPGPVNASSTSVIAVGAIADSALVPPPTEPGVVGTATSDPGPGVSGGSSPGSPGVGTAVPPDPADPPVPVGVPERMAGMEPAKPTPLTAN